MLNADFFDFFVLSPNQDGLLEVASLSQGAVTIWLVTTMLLL